MNPVENGPEDEVADLLAKAAYPETCKAFLALGKTPKEIRSIAVDGVDINGYVQFVLDESGQRVLNDEGSPLFREHEWASMKDALSVLEPLLMEKAKRGLL